MPAASWMTTIPGESSPRCGSETYRGSGPYGPVMVWSGTGGSSRRSRGGDDLTVDPHSPGVSPLSSRRRSRSRRSGALVVGGEADGLRDAATAGVVALGGLDPRQDHLLRGGGERLEVPLRRGAAGQGGGQVVGDDERLDVVQDLPRPVLLGDLDRA